MTDEKKDNNTTSATITISISAEDVRNGLSEALKYAGENPTVESLSLHGTAFAFLNAAGRAANEQVPEVYDDGLGGLGRVSLAMGFLAKADFSSKEIMQAITGKKDISAELEESIADLSEEMQDDGFAKKVREEAQRQAAELIESTITDIHAPDLQPYIDAELQKSEYEGKDLDDLTLKEAREVLEAAKTAAGKPSVRYNQITGLQMNLDRVNSIFFGADIPLPLAKDINGQMQFTQLYYEGYGQPEATLYVNYSFDEDLLKRFNLEKKVIPEDFFTLTFIANHYLQNNKTVSISKLYRDMNGEDPNSRQLAAFTDNLIRLSGIHFYARIDEILQAWGKADDIPDEFITGPLAPITVRGGGKFHGKNAKGKILIHDVPPIFFVGRAIGQYITIPKSLVVVRNKQGRRVRGTSRHYLALRILLKEVARIKSGRRNRKILYKTFFEDMRETTARGQQAAKEQLYTILEHFRREGYISGYREEKTKTTGEIGVLIFYDKPQGRIAANKGKKYYRHYGKKLPTLR